MATMRERLIARAEATAETDSSGAGAWQVEWVRNWPEVIDALLAELEAPDDEMAWMGFEHVACFNGAIGESSQEAAKATFTAMVKQVRTGES